MSREGVFPIVVTPRPDFDPVFDPDPRPDRGGDRGGVLGMWKIGVGIGVVSRETGKSGWGTGRGFKIYKSET